MHFVRMVSPLVKKFLGLLRVHWLVVAAGMVLTLLIFYPLFSFPVVAKDVYQGINIAHFGTDEHFYLTRGKEALEGHTLGNSVLREGKDEQDAFFTYNERVITAPIRWLGLPQSIDIVTLYNVYNFIGIFILILLIYSVVWQLSHHKLLSTVAPLVMIGGYSIVYNKTLFYADFNMYGRAMFPYISSLAFFAYLSILLKSLKTPKTVYTVCAGMLFGGLFYVYFFTWTFAGALTGILLCVYLLRREFNQAKSVAITMAIGLVLGAYNVWRLFTYVQTDFGQQLSYFQWSSHGHGFIFSKIGAVALVVFAVYAYKRKDDKNLPFVLACILSGWVALNQQVLTGRFVQYAHYYWYFIVPVCIMLCLYMLWALWPNARYQKTIFVLLVGIVYLNTAVGQYRSSLATIPAKRHEQNFRPLINTLNREPYGVIITPNSSDSYLFTIYTNDDVFWNSAAPTFHTPFQHMKDALYVYLAITKNTRQSGIDAINQIMQDPSRANEYADLYENIEGYLSGYDYYDYLARLARQDGALLQKRPPLLAQLKGEYAARVAAVDAFRSLVKSYGVEYIVWDEQKNPEWDLTVFPHLQTLAESGSIHLYRIDW